MPATVRDDREAELSALRELVNSPGWQFLLRYANQEWSSRALLDRVRQDIPHAALKGCRDGAELLATALAEQDAVKRLLDYPLNTVQRLEARASQPDPPLIPPRA